MTQKGPVSLKGVIFALALCLNLGLMLTSMTGLPAEASQPAGLLIGLILFVTLLNIDTHARHRETQN
jgi:formate hydrogenlyase subunit 4